MPEKLLRQRAARAAGLKKSALIAAAALVATATIASRSTDRLSGSTAQHSGGLTRHILGDLGILAGGVVAVVTLDAIHIWLGIVGSFLTVTLIAFRVWHEWRHRND